MVKRAGNQISLLRNILSKSLVSYTLTNDCFLRCWSLDQIAEFVDNAKAIKSISSGSDIKSAAFSKKNLYSEDEIKSIDSFTSAILISNCCSESLDLFKHSSLCSSNSDFINFGAIKFTLIEANKYADIDSGLIIENRILLSNTNCCILNYLYSLLFSGETFESNFSRISGETSLSNCLNLPFLAFLPNSTLHLINSCSSLDWNLFNNNSASLFLLASRSLTNSDQLIQRSFAISDFNSLSIARVIEAIYNSPLDFNNSHFFNSSIFSLITLRATSATFTSGNSFLNSASNSSGIDNVILGIFITSSVREISNFSEHPKVHTSKQGLSDIYVNSSKYVYLNLSVDDFQLEKRCENGKTK